MNNNYLITVISFIFLYPFHLRSAEVKEDNGSLKPVEIPKHFEVQRNLVYKTVGDEKLTFDYIKPVNPQQSSGPLLIFIHGGGWRGGNKEAFYRRLFFDSVIPLMQKGMRVVTINYRLAKKGGTTTVESVNDCKDAVRYFAANANKFGADPAQFVLMGGSAGGHLTLMTALAPDDDYPSSDSKLDSKLPNLAAAVPFYPLCHFGDPLIMGESLYGQPQRFDAMLGGPWKEKEDLARKLSPIYLLHKDAPPILVLHGDEDPVLPVLSARLFVEKAKEIGAPVKYLEVKNGNHGFRTADDPKLDGIIKHVTAYLKEHLKFSD